MAAALFNSDTSAGAKSQNKVSEISFSEHKTIHTFNERSLYPVVGAKRLLAAIMRQRFLREIKETVSLPEEYFTALYQALINAFASSVQILPVNNEARLYSLLDEGLVRANYALQYYKKDQKGEVDPLLSYVIFTAALLFDVGCIIENRTVIISKQDSTFLRVWDPYHEPAMPEGAYYKIRHGGGTLPWSSRRSAVTLACKLLPKVGFEWIYKNPHVFNIWIALLVDDKEGAGGLRHYFDRAREALDGLKTAEEFFKGDIDIEEIKEVKETQHAEDFLEWLKKEIEDNKIVADAAYAEIFHLEGDKLFLTKELFDRYTASVGGAISSERLVDEFSKLGFASGDVVGYFYGQKRAAAQQGAAATAPQGHVLFSGRTMFGAHPAGEAAAATATAEGKAAAPAADANVSEPQAVAAAIVKGITYGLVVSPTYVENITHGLAIAVGANPVALTAASGEQTQQLPPLETQTPAAAQPAPERASGSSVSIK